MRVFQVGDQVYLKLEPYVQALVTTRSNQNMALKFFGPYIVIQCVGYVAYKLQMPESSMSGTIIRGTLKAPKSQLVTPISTKLQRPDGCN
jgi:hypothetical protein